MSFSPEDSKYLNELLLKYGFGISLAKNNEGNDIFVLYQDVKEADSLAEILQWIILEFEDK